MPHSHHRVPHRPPAKWITAACALLVVAGGSVACGTSQAAGSSGSKTIQVMNGNVLSGPSAPGFVDSTDGFKSYFKYINDHGGVNGYQIALTQYDTKYDPAQGVPIAHKIVNAKPLAVVGGFGGTPVDSAVYSYVRTTSLPVVAPLAAAQTFKGSESTNYFLMVPDYSQVTQLMVQFAHDHLGTRSVAVAYTDDVAGMPAEAGVTAAAGKLGITVAKKVPFPTKGSDYGSYAAALKASGADTAIIWAPPAAAAPIQKAAAAAGYHPKWILPFFDATAAWKQLGGTDGTYFDTWLTPVDPANPANPDVKNFVDLMQSEYPNTGPTSGAEQAWAAGSIFVAALKKATANGQAPTQASLVKALAGLSLSNGIISGISYQNSHLGVQQETYVQARGNQFTPVESGLQLPAPLAGD
jgi:branched-chain amino acid transport system substrate-binding protein